MAQIDEINQRLEDCVDEAEAIKTKIKDVAESKGITVVDGTDTPITVLTKINNATVPTPTGTINITQNGSNIDVSNYAKADVLVQSQDSLVVKGLADGSLTSFKASDYGVTTLKDRRFQDFTSLTSLDLTGITDIPAYTAYRASSLENLTLDDNPTRVNDYAFNSTKIKRIKGNFSYVGSNAFAYIGTSVYKYLESVDIKVNGSLGSNAFSNNDKVNTFNLDSSSNITSLGSNCFANFGNTRSGTTRFIFDFRNSTFTTLNNNVFAGSSSYKNKYFTIYFPETLYSTGNYMFQYTNYFNIYYKNLPIFSTSPYSNATNYKNFFPYNLAQSAKVATNWVSIASSIYGYSDTNEFSLGDTLPETDTNGYTLTWYSDEAMTTQVTTVSDPTKMYYCQVGSRTKVKLSTTQYQATLTVSDGTNTYTNGDLVPIGATLTITAVGDTGYPDPYTFTLNGTTISSGDTYSVTSSDIVIVCIYYDGVNPPVDPVFANNTPQQIKIAVDNGLHRALWTIGDSIPVTLTNGIVGNIYYIDQVANRYEKSDSSGYSNAVFEFRPLVTTRAMNSSSTNAGGWPASDMCTIRITEIYDLLPSDWQAIITEVKVPSATSGNNSTIVYANNKMFIPSGQEIFANTSNYYYDEGCTQFDWYSTHNTNADRIRQYNNTNTNYWLRSPRYGSTANFIIVSTNGGYDSSLASSGNGVSPVFAI